MRACAYLPSAGHAHNNRPRLFQLLHSVSAQYGENEGLWLSAHGRLPGTLRYMHAYATR